MMQATRIPRQPPVALSLRLANGECFVVTLDSWRKFLARLENKSLTNESASTHTPSREGHSTHGLVRQA